MVQLGALHVVPALIVGLPHVDACMGDALAVDAADGSADEAGFAARAVRYVVAMLVLRRIGYVEGTEHRGLGAA
jgi:hypothetical protein